MAETQKRVRRTVEERAAELDKKIQDGIVDAFARDTVAEAKKKVREAYKEYKACEKELKETSSDAGGRAKELSFLQFEAREIREADLNPGEDEDLEVLYRRMANSKEIAECVSEAYLYTSEGNENASESLSRAIHAISDIAKYDDTASGLYDQLVEIDSLLNDFNRELAA